MTASYVKSVTVDCADPLVVAAFWAGALGSNVDEDSTSDKAFVEPAGWGGPSMWFVKVPEPKSAKNRMHFDLRAPGAVVDEVARLAALGATVQHERARAGRHARPGRQRVLRRVSSRPAVINLAFGRPCGESGRTPHEKNQPAGFTHLGDQTH